METPDTLLQDPGAPPPSARPRPRARVFARHARRSGPRPDGLLLERYALLERLGAGGFGEVWRARDELLHREVAVKRVHVGSAGSSERAAREALAAARLSHPAIVALYEACADGEDFYLISELVDGYTLATLIRSGELDDEEALEIGLALAAAVAHAHARGVIHRDIKPHNVLVPHHVEDAAGAAKLTDFGGAALAGEEALTHTGDVLGTLAYMSPEQSEGCEASEQSDVYSLALVLYEALCGYNPVRGSTPAATARRIGGRLEPLERRRADLPSELTRAIDAALARDPRRRGTLEDLRAALARALESGPAQAGASAPVERVRAAPPSPPAAPPGRSPRAGRLPGAPESRAHAHARDHEEEAAAAGEPEARHGRLAAPRAVWLALALALVAWQAVAGRPGVAVLLAAALLPLLALPRRAGPAWLVCVLAPLLGLAGLAGAYPAIAGQARRWAVRAALGALGYWWLLLAEPLLARRLWLGVHSGTPPRSGWEGSLDASAIHVVAPLLGAGLLLGALAWALAAAALPWIVRGRNAALDIVAATVWAAAVVAAEPLIAAHAAAAGVHAQPRGAVLGGVLAGVLAVAARALRGPV